MKATAGRTLSAMSAIDGSGGWGADVPAATLGEAIAAGLATPVGDGGGSVGDGGWAVAVGGALVGRSVATGVFVGAGAVGFAGAFGATVGLGA
jgi:hypothetical protein